MNGECALHQEVKEITLSKDAQQQLEDAIGREVDAEKLLMIIARGVISLGFCEAVNVRNNEIAFHDGTTRWSTPIPKEVKDEL